MTKVSMSTKLPVSPDEVWELIGGFNALPDWHPAVTSSEIKGKGKGSVRTLSLAGGGSIVEKLEQLDEKGRTYSYSILSSPLPVANYTGTIHIEEDKDGKAKVTWESEFEPMGAPEGDAMEVIQGIYQSGFDNLQKMFGMKS